MWDGTASRGWRSATVEHRSRRVTTVGPSGGRGQQPVDGLGAPPRSWASVGGAHKRQTRQLPGVPGTGREATGGARASPRATGNAFDGPLEEQAREICPNCEWGAAGLPNNQSVPFLERGSLRGGRALVSGREQIPQVGPVARVRQDDRRGAPEPARVCPTEAAVATRRSPWSAASPRVWARSTTAALTGARAPAASEQGAQVGDGQLAMVEQLGPHESVEVGVVWAKRRRRGGAGPAGSGRRVSQGQGELQRILGRRERPSSSPRPARSTPEWRSPAGASVAGARVHALCGEGPAPPVPPWAVGRRRTTSSSAASGIGPHGLARRAPAGGCRRTRRRGRAVSSWTGSPAWARPEPMRAA